MKFKFYSAVPESLDEVEAKECYSVGEIQCARELLAIGMTQKESACIGMGVEGRLYAVMGSYMSWPGSSQLWAIFDAEVDRYPIALTRACLQIIDYAKEKQGLYRVSLTVKSSYTKGNQFAEVLGFSLEGRMRCFMPDASDANLYARLF